MADEKWLDDLKDNNKWLLRAVTGTVIGAVMALLFFEFDLNHIFINQS